MLSQPIREDVGQYVRAVVYDLGSENMQIFSNTNVYDKVRSIRVRSVQLLHSLGVQCTESVILVSPSRVEDVERVITRVKALYLGLNTYLRSNGFDVELRPIIEVLDLTQSQFERLMPIAYRRLISALDEAIEHVNRVIDELAAISDEARLGRIRFNLRRFRDNWERIHEYARSLGIDITRDYEALVDLIDEALRRVGGP
jgi:hypothetical protein